MFLDDTETKYEFYSDIQSKSVEWLWYPYIPYGKLRTCPHSQKCTINAAQKEMNIKAYKNGWLWLLKSLLPVTIGEE